MTEKINDMSSTVRLENIAKSASVSLKNQPGVLTQHIGSGENAKNSIIFITIRWCFIVGVGLSLLAFASEALFNRCSSIVSVDDIWAIFSPLIALSLGYLFGKSN